MLYRRHYSTFGIRSDIEIMSYFWVLLFFKKKIDRASESVQSARGPADRDAGNSARTGMQLANDGYTDAGMCTWMNMWVCFRYWLYCIRLTCEVSGSVSHYRKILAFNSSRRDLKAHIHCVEYHVYSSAQCFEFVTQPDPIYTFSAGCWIDPVWVSPRILSAYVSQLRRGIHRDD